MIKSSLKKIRQLGQEQLTLHARGFWRYSPQMLMGFVIIAITFLIFPREPSFEFANLREGDVYMGKEIIAPFTFFINKSPEEYERDKKLAAEKVPPVFVRVDSIEVNEIQKFNQFFAELEIIRKTSEPDTIRIKKLQELLNNYFIIIEKENLPLLLKSQISVSKKISYSVFKQNIKRILTDIFTIGVLNKSIKEFPHVPEKISIISENQEILDDPDNYYDPQTVEQVVLEKLRQAFSQEDIASKIGYQILYPFIKPNIIYDPQETNRRKEESIARVPIAKGTVLANERIITPHERITKETLEKLRSLAEARAEREKVQGGLNRLLPEIGRILLIILSLSFTAIFLFFARPEIFYNVKKLSIIFIIFLIILLAAFFINRSRLSEYWVPIAIASMLITIFFDTRTAFICTLTLSIFLGLLWGNEFTLMLISLFVGTMSTFAVREIQARLWILKGMVTITLSYFFSIGAVELIRSGTLAYVGKEMLNASFNGIFSPILTYGLMVIFEYFFKMTTNSTLLELSDLNKPLLRQLAFRAPGTYHHSILVGNLAEAAAEAIGANGLLTRVGAYYHDIGKMEMPEYFVENQKGGKNPHEKLTPSMSCLILINHVKRGLEIAEAHGLPKEILEFIPQHHGTNLITYFYKKALEMNGETEINEADFRYPGPKPQTKETGIVMLADAVEAASRTLKEPTVGRIKNMVNTIIQERLIDGQLDDCPLTLKELSQIKESFVNILTGIFHGRIEYPGQEKKFLKKKIKEEQPKEKVVESKG